MMIPWYENELEYAHGSTKIVCDSVNKYGDRLTTIEGIIWRPVLAEVNTHRVFSRNSASSRAIPLRRKNRRGTLDLIEDYPAGPMYWGAEKSGMQSGEELDGLDLLLAKGMWDQARAEAISFAEGLQEVHLHKSLVNRLLEPFMWHRIIITATHWENFFAQRSWHHNPKPPEPGPMPEFAIFATKIEDLLKESTPQILGFDQWHLPYILPDEEHLPLEVKKSISVGRCGRVSFLNHDLVKDPDEDVAFCERLKGGKPIHSSPFEHVATPGYDHPNNFQGWLQLRQVVEIDRGIKSRA